MSNKWTEKQKVLKKKIQKTIVADNLVSEIALTMENEFGWTCSLEEKHDISVMIKYIKLTEESLCPLIAEMIVFISSLKSGFEGNPFYNCNIHDDYLYSSLEDMRHKFSALSNISFANIQETYDNFITILRDTRHMCSIDSSDELNRILDIIARDRTIDYIDEFCKSMISLLKSKVLGEHIAYSFFINEELRYQFIDKCFQLEFGYTYDRVYQYKDVPLLEKDISLSKRTLIKVLSYFSSKEFLNSLHNEAISCLDFEVSEKDLTRDIQGYIEVIKDLLENDADDDISSVLDLTEYIMISDYSIDVSEWYKEINFKKETLTDAN